MTTIRISMLLAVTAVSLAGPFAERFGRANAAKTALALLAEADELCRGTDRNPLPDRATSAAVARLAAGAEAVVIASEEIRRIEEPSLRRSTRGISESLAEHCRPEGLLGLTGLSDAAGAGLEAGLEPTYGVTEPDRATLLAPFVARLNGAALRAVEARSGPARSVVDKSPAGSPKPARAPVTKSRDAGAEERRGAALAGPDGSPIEGETDPPAVFELRIGASEEHRRRVAAWSPVFRREAGRLWAARRALQVEIDKYSLAEARLSCRSFGRVLDHLDPDLGRMAANRELSLLVERMLARYRQGVAHCMAGRTAAAYSYLSEGDRDGSALARAAARILEPRPARSPRDRAAAPPGGARPMPRR